MSKLRISLKIKYERYGKFAEEGARFYDSCHDFMWDKSYSNGPTGFLDQEATLPKFRMSVNRIFEAVAMFGPALYHQNPNVLVAPRLGVNVSPLALGLDPMDPMAAQQWQIQQQQEQMRREIQSSCADVKSAYLNWLQGESDKKQQARPAITESIVRGMGLLRTEMYQPPSSRIKYPRSTYQSEKDFTCDPDADYWEDVQWVAFRRIVPVNKAEAKFGLQPGTLKGHLESANNQAELDTDWGRDNRRKREDGQSFDLLEYWEIHSKNGFGDKLNLAAGNHKTAFDFSQFGDFCYIVVAQGIPFPLNFPPESHAEDANAQFQRSQWPIPFWYDSAGQGGWPMARLYFYDTPQSVWPVPFVKPVISLMRFVNWCMSFLGDKVAQNATTYVGILKEANAQMQQQLQGNASPYTVLEISNVLGKRIDEVVSFLQAPPFSLDIWKMVSEAIQMIDKGTGLTELIYGLTGTSMRSATEANVRDQNVSIRPDDMAAKTEDWLTTTVVREMQAARWFCGPEDVAGAVGPQGAMVWQNIIMQTDPEAVVRDFDYTIEAGSAKKPNKQQKIQQLTDFAQVALPTIQQFAMQGMTEPWNALMQDMAKANDLDASRYLIQPFQPPQEQPEQNTEPSPEEEAAVREAEFQQGLQHTEIEHQQKVAHQADMNQVAIDAAEEKAAIQAKAAKTKAAAKPKPKPKAKAKGK